MWCNCHNVSLYTGRNNAMEEALQRCFSWVFQCTRLLFPCTWLNWILHDKWINSLSWITNLWHLNNVFAFHYKMPPCLAWQCTFHHWEDWILFQSLPITDKEIHFSNSFIFHQVWIQDSHLASSILNSYFALNVFVSSTILQCVKPCLFIPSSKNKTMV